MRVHSLAKFTCVLFLAVGTLHAQQLTVTSANAKVIELTWTGAAGTASLERSNGQSFQKIAAADAGKYADHSIDPFGTYQYRINTAGKFSNVFTVGPPPAGVTNAAPAPKGSDLANDGPATAVALDENGDPAIAFEVIDPNGDGDKSDTEIRFAHWNRAGYKWLPPVKVATTGALQDQYVNPIALAFDAGSGSFAVLAAAGDNLVYAVSSDHGATWKTMPVSNTSGTPHALSMTIASGQAHAAVNGEESAVYLTGAPTDPGSWKAKPVPAGAGWKVHNNSNIAIVADAGKVALGYYEDQAEGDGHRYVFWQPAQSDPVAIATGGSTDVADIALASGANQFGALVASQLDANGTEHGVWYSQSADGSSWSKPVKLPIDGPRSTNAPLGLAMDSKGALTAVFGSNSGSAAAACNAPTVSRSADGAAWKTCGLGKAAGADFSPQPPTVHAIEAPNDKAYVIWQEQGETKYAPGVLVWHER